MRTLHDSYTLSPQQVTSCDNEDYGCSGGRTQTAYDYVGSTSKGLEQEEVYPYVSGKTGKTGTCASDASLNVVTVTDYFTIGDESSMAAHVGASGPLSICVDSSSWASYTGGVLSACGKDVDHCVQAVGIDTANGYWIVSHHTVRQPRPLSRVAPHRIKCW